MRTAIERGIGAAVRHSLVYWIQAPGTAGRRSKFLAISLTSAVRPRGQDVEGKVRNVDQIADPEIEATVRLVVAAMGGAGQEDIVVATARAFGYSRTGETVETRLRKCIQRMVSEGSLIERLGSLVVA